MFISASTPVYSVNTLTFLETFEPNSVVQVTTPASMPSSASVLSFVCSGEVEGEVGTFTFPVMFPLVHYGMAPSTDYSFAFDGYYFRMTQGPVESNPLTY